MLIPENLRLLSVREIVDYITNVDERDLTENYASEIRGLRLARPGLVTERDFGTVNRYAAAAYPSTPSAITMIDGFPLLIPTEAIHYDIVAGLDTSTNTRLYAGNGTTFEELTQVYSFTIGTISGLTMTSSGVLLSHLGATQGALPPAGGVADYFENYIAYVVRNQKASLVTASTAWTGAGTITITLINTPDGAMQWAPGDQVYLYRFTGILPSGALGADRGYEFSNGATPHIRWLSVEAQNKLFMLYGSTVNPPTVPVTVPRQPIQIRKGRFLNPDSFTLGGADAGWEEASDVGSPTVVSVAAAVRPITNATFATPIVVSLAAHGYSNGDSVYITGVLGNTEANGTWVIANVAAGTFELVGSVGNAAYVSGGQVEHLWSIYSGQPQYSRDGGATWTAQTASGVLGAAIEMFDYTTGYLCGSVGRVFKTVDSGTTWTEVGVAGGLSALQWWNKITVINATTCFVMSSSKVFRTADSGGTWTDVTPAAFAIGYNIDFVDVDNGWIVDAGRIHRTTNGSALTPTWANVVVPNPGSPVRFFAINFASTTVGWIGGEYGYVYKTTDGGVNWVYEPTGGTVNVYAIHSTDINNARLCGEYGDIFATTDGGASWVKEFGTPTTPHLFDIWLTSSATGYAVGNDGKVYRLFGVAGNVGLGGDPGWYIDKAQLLPDFQRIATTSAPRNDADVDETIVIGEGLKLKFSYDQEADGTNQYALRMYGTMLYAGAVGEDIHQESDPIFHLSLRPAAPNSWARPIITVYINPALINKNFVGIRFYMAVNNINDLALTEWIDDPSDYLYSYDLLTTSLGWAIDTADEYAYSNEVDEFKLADRERIITSGPTNIFDQLNHPIDVNRAYQTPRYATKAGRSQGSVIVWDEGDRKIRMSSYDGDDNHQEDNFPDVTTDNVGQRQQTELTGHGELLGLASMRGVIYAFKSTELETYDLQSTIRDLVPCDFYAKKSLMGVGVADNPNGLLWSGNSGIWYLPIGGGRPVMVSAKISNLFDGSKMVDHDGVTPYMTDAYRQGILCGYDQTYREAWIQMQINKKSTVGSEYLCFRYNFDVAKFYVRELNITGSRAAFFYGKPDDHSFTIGTPTMILRYPYRVALGAASIYEDEVTSAGLTASKGIPTKIRINIGSLYGLQASFVPWDLLIDYIASVTNSRAADIVVYANGIAVDTKTIALDTLKPPPMMIEPIGQTESLEIEISLPAANLVDFKKLEIRQIDVRYLSQRRIGTE